MKKSSIVGIIPGEFFDSTYCYKQGAPNGYKQSAPNGYKQGAPNGAAASGRLISYKQ